MDEPLFWLQFDDVLHHSKSLPYFLDFLVEHGCANGLLFWIAVEQFKCLTGRTKDSLQQARVIFDQFFAIPPAQGCAPVGFPRSIMVTETWLEKSKTYLRAGKLYLDTFTDIQVSIFFTHSDWHCS